MKHFYSVVLSPLVDLSDEEIIKIFYLIYFLKLEVNILSSRVFQKYCYTGVDVQIEVLSKEYFVFGLS